MAIGEIKVRTNVKVYGCGVARRIARCLGAVGFSAETAYAVTRHVVWVRPSVNGRPAGWYRLPPLREVS